MERLALLGVTPLMAAAHKYEEAIPIYREWDEPDRARTAHEKSLEMRRALDSKGAALG